MTGSGKRIARTGALTALLLLLLLPAGASAATPAELIGQTVATVNGVVENTGATVARTVTDAQQALGGGVPVEPVNPADPVPVAPTSGTALGAKVERTVAAAETTVAAATGQDLLAAARPAAAKRPAAHTRREARPPAASPRSSAPEMPASRASLGVAATASDEVATGPAPRKAPQAQLPSTSSKPAGAQPAGPTFGASSGGGVASAAFSAGAVAVLLMALCLTASALKTRLPRFDEVGRPLPLVFALERPG